MEPTAVHLNAMALATFYQFSSVGQVVTVVTYGPTVMATVLGLLWPAKLVTLRPDHAV